MKLAPKNSLVAGILVLGVLLACKSQKPVESRVNCRYQGQFVCDVATTGELGKRYNVCWDIDVSCADNQKLSANTCMDVSGQGNATSAVPNDRFRGGFCRTGNVTSVAVNNVVIKNAN
jgi:hypothetical protein